MRNGRSRTLAFLSVMILVNIIGVFLAIVLLDYFFEVELPRYLSFVIGSLSGAVTSLFLSRDQIARNSDPFSAETRARITANQIAVSRSESNGCSE